MYPKITSYSFLCLLLLFLAACNNSDEINEFMPMRHFIIYASDVTQPLPEPSQINSEEQVINGNSTIVTRFRFTDEDISRSAGMAQSIELKNDNRLLGIRFHIRSLSGHCSLIPILITTDTHYSNYVYQENIVLDGNNWQEVTLTFQDFTDTRSRMHLDIDSLYPGYHNATKLYLIPWESTGTDKVLEWGPLSAVKDKNRYRFY